MFRSNNQEIQSIWVEKYRPHDLIQIASHTKIISTLRHFLTHHELPHLFFFGPAGTGKTSTIISLAHELYGKHYNNLVLHLNASDVECNAFIQKDIMDFITTKPFFVKFPFKLIILDEADAMPHKTQLLLKDILNLNNLNVRVCLIGNYQYSLIDELCSHFVKFLFIPISLEHTATVAHTILQQEQYTIESEAIESIYQISNGDLRKFINILQSLCIRLTSPEAHITNAFTKSCLLQCEQLLDLEYLKDLLTHYNLVECKTRIYELMHYHGYDFTTWLKQISHKVIEYLCAKKDGNNRVMEFCLCASDLEYNSIFLVEHSTQLLTFVILLKHVLVVAL